MNREEPIAVHESGVVLLWGPPRSGTTWLFNVVRSLLAVGDVPHATWVAGQRPPRLRGPETLVVKAHRPTGVDFIRSGAHACGFFTTAILREPASAFQSLLRTQTAHRTELLTWLHDDITGLADALPHLDAPVVMREEWIADRSDELVAALVQYLGLQMSDDDIQRVSSMYHRERVRATVEEMDRRHGWSGDFRNYDPHSHWHGGHIAPRDHVPNALSAAEVRTLSELRKLVDDLTLRHSLFRADLRAPSGGVPVARRFLRHAAPGRRLMPRLLTARAS